MTATDGLDVAPFDERPRFDAATGELIGGRCGACSASAWPRRAMCHRCGAAAVEAWRLPVDGVLETWSRVWIPLPGVDAPYIVGIVRLGAARVFARVYDVDDIPATPAPVRLELQPDASPFFRVRVVDSMNPSARDQELP